MRPRKSVLPRRRFDEDAAFDRWFEETVSLPPRDPTYGPGILRIVTLATVASAAYRQRARDEQRWRARGPRKGRTKRNATEKVRAFNRWRRRHDPGRRLSEKAAARAFLARWDEAWHPTLGDECDTKVESLLRLVRRRR